ncbi:hypothetical protein FDECE_7908 [Fusarium decemcellulare]|nr:hypothetical protein FDECE_7908 [Fusarium decemcellulare]
MDASNSPSTRLLTYLGFAILGLVNAIVPFIVHSANYLIIPYPRWVVILIEILPALLTKLIIPHFLHHVPYWMRPLKVGSCWIIVALIIKGTPPNIAPPIRIFTTALASASAAAMEVSFLGMMRYYGRSGLAGWGAGVGAGAVFCAVLPFVLTVWMESFLRDFIDCIYALTGAMLFAFFVILPGAPVNYPDFRHDRGKGDIEDDQDGASLLVLDPVQELSRVLSTKNRLNLTKVMVGPFMVPLFGAFTAQTLAYPGIARALPLSASAESFFSYSTTFGLAFQLGNFVSRTHTPLFRPQSTTIAFMILGTVTGILLLNATFVVFSSQVLVGLLAFGAGIGGGAVYMTILDRVLEEKSLDPGINQEFSLQVVGAGETAGVLAGGLLGTMLEALMCGGGGKGPLMLKRRTHNKSRHGCRNCKKRHVKCDEGGPPCANCAVRGLEGCSYLADPPTQIPATETRRRLELELMHRWSTTTYKSLVSIPEDGEWLLDDMPRWALKHEYLLHGMFAFSALEVALTGGGVMDDDPAVYVKLALEYYDKGSRQFRAQLEDVKPENSQQMFMFSFLAVGINMALAQCRDIISFDEQQNILDRMVTLWELLMGNASVANLHYDALISGALSRSTDALMLRTQLQRTTPSSIPLETEAAIARLSTIVDTAAQTPEGSSPEAQSDSAVRIQAYRASVSAIQTCFIEDSKDLFKGIAIAFPALAGKNFGVALKQSDPVAMYLMMHWGVQLHSLGKQAWWVGTFGKMMVRELSEMLWQPESALDVAVMPEWREGIVWARMEVELPPMEVLTPEASI